MMSDQDKTIENQLNSVLLQSIVDNTNAVIYIKNTKGQYLLINNQYEDLFNVSKADAIGMTDYDLFPEDIADKFNSNDKSVLLKEMAESFEEVVRFKGDEHYYISNKFPVYDAHNQLYGLCGISTDITEIIQSRDLILKRELEFNTLVSNIQGVVYRCATTKDWQMYVMSDYIEELSGYPASDFIMNNERSFASIIHPDDLEKVEAKVMQGLSNNTSYIITYRIIHKDGSVRWGHEKGIGYYDDNEKSAKYLDGVIVDITAEKKLEQIVSTKNIALEKINTQLEERILLRTQHLDASNKELRKTIEQLKETQQQLIESRKMVAIGSLVRGICHELGTPLSNSLSITTYTTLEIEKFLERLSDQSLDNREIEEFLTNIISLIRKTTSQTNKSINITDNLRMIADDPNENRLSTFDLSDYLETIVSIKKRNFENKDIQLTFRSSGPIIIKTYPSLLYQVIDSLIANTELHGFEHLDKGEIQLSLSHTQDTITLIYKDDGVGVDDNLISKLFDPFYTSKMGKHSGLGLFLIYNIITQKLNGAIECDSSLNQGITFKITLPQSL